MRVLVVGAGNVGGLLAKLLSMHGNDVIVVDKDEGKIRSVQREADVMGIVRDATDPALYDEIDLASMDVVVAATDRDEVNLLVATLAVESGVPRVIVRTRSPKIAKIMERVGVEYTITGPAVVAKLILAIIEGRFQAVPLIPVFAGDYVLASITISETDSSVGKTLGELSVPEGVRLLAVFDGENFLEPSGGLEIAPNSIIIALVRRDMLEEFERVFR
uniref:TrkA family potassium uptake protein n=1 Tax=Fervidicoccus fontis TaxID=683846 RepID=A0A7J3ZKP2_9CREN